MIFEHYTLPLVSAGIQQSHSLTTITQQITYLCIHSEFIRSFRRFKNKWNISLYYPKTFCDPNIPKQLDAGRPPIVTASILILIAANSLSASKPPGGTYRFAMSLSAWCSLGVMGDRYPWEQKGLWPYIYILYVIPYFLSKLPDPPNSICTSNFLRRSLWHRSFDRRFGHSSRSANTTRDMTHHGSDPKIMEKNNF